MKKQHWMVIASVAGLLALTSAGIVAFKERQKLGKPGLKVAQRPILDEKGQPVGTQSIDLPERVLNYVSSNAPITTLELDILPKDTTFGRRRYIETNGIFADISVVLMGTDRTSIHKPEICLVGQGWKIERAELASIPIERPHRYDLPVMKLSATREQKLADGRKVNFPAIFLYWFVSEKRLTAEHKDRMWAMVEDLLKTGVIPRWAYVSCFSACYPGQEEFTYQRMRELIAAAVPEFQLATLPPKESAPPTTAAVPSDSHFGARLCAEHQPQHGDWRKPSGICNVAAAGRDDTTALQAKMRIAAAVTVTPLHQP